MERAATKKRFRQTLAEAGETAKTQPRLTAAELVWIFTLGCFIGFVAETLFCFIFKGVWESRQAMLYGPFNQVYGFGAVFMTAVLLPFVGQPAKHQLVVGAAVGGIMEVSVSLFEQIAFGTRSWEYSAVLLPLFGGRTNLIYMLLFGVMGLLFMRWVLPAIRWLIAAIPRHIHKWGALALAVFFAVNLTLSGAAVHRWTARQRGIEAQSTTAVWLDETYPDERMQRLYPVMELREE